MALRRDRRRISAVSATLSAGALVFFAAGSGPASADTGAAAECKLGKLLCGILGGGSSTPATPPPKPSTRGGGTPDQPKTKPKPAPKPIAKPAPSAHHGAAAGGSGGDSAGGPNGAAPAVPPPARNVPAFSIPGAAQGPALPDVANQDPLVLPEPGGRTAGRLVAESDPAGGTASPILVATASGLIGAVAALNLSVLRRRKQD